MSMDDEVPVKLTDEDREARQTSLLYHLGEAERLEQKLRDDTSAAKKLIAAEWAECYRLRRVLLDDQENRRQGELFVTDEQATAALAEVAKAAGERCPYHATLPGTDTVTNQQCTLLAGHDGDEHDYGSVAPVPTEPHPFRCTPESPVACVFDGCGRTEGDHETPHLSSLARAGIGADPPTCPACATGECRVHPHAFNPAIERNEAADCDVPTGRCACGFAKRAKIHRAEEAYAFGGEEPAPEIASDSPLVHGA